MRTEEALDASATEAGDLPRRAIPRRSLSPDREDDDDDDEEDMLSGGRKEDLMKKKRLQQPFNPFCNVDQVQVSIHCHVNGVNSLVCAPGLVSSDLSECVCECAGDFSVCTSVLCDGDLSVCARVCCVMVTLVSVCCVMVSLVCARVCCVMVTLVSMCCVMVTLVSACTSVLCDGDLSECVHECAVWW